MKPEVLQALAVLAGQLTGSSGAAQFNGPQYRAVSATASLPYYTGPGGLFGTPGLERDVFSTRILPMGLADRLPVMMSNVMHPLFAYLTGFTAGEGSEPAGPCDDPPTPGNGKTCYQTAQFGRFSRQTRVFDIDRLGQQINRGEFQDQRIVNDPLLGGMGGITVPSSIGGSVTSFRQEVAMRMIELGVEFQNWMSRQLYEGNPANSNAGGGYKEFAGLDILVGTDKVDAQTGANCPSLDSDIKDFGYARVDSAAEKMITQLSYMMRFLGYNAEHMNMGQVTHVFVMRPSLFWELTAVWPCQYLTYRCQTLGVGNSASVDAADMVRMRDDMRQNNYLVLDGRRYEVILDSNIREETNTQSANVSSGCFASDIYILPLTVRGGMPVLYWETRNYRESLALAADMGGADAGLNTYFWTDDGRYLWHRKPPQNFCMQYLAKIEPRIILRTPHLAGRLTNVQYCPLQHERDVRNSDPYFVNGGVSTGRPQNTLYSDWGQVTNSN